jgi:hypothetical protein
MMVVREVTKQDYFMLMNIADSFRKEFYQSYVSRDTGLQPFNQIMTMIYHGAGVGLIAVENDQPVGAILSVMSPHIWDSTNYMLNEVMFYVMPDKRKGTAGGRLLKKYVEVGDKLIEADRISHYTMAQTNRTNLNYEKYGFKLTEQIYVRN